MLVDNSYNIINIVSDNIEIIHHLFSVFLKFWHIGTFIYSTAGRLKAADPPLARDGCVWGRFKLSCKSYFVQFSNAQYNFSRRKYGS